MKYDFKSIEKKWQDKWDAEQAFVASEDYSKPKFYGLPSAMNGTKPNVRIISATIPKLSVTKFFAT